MVDVRVTPRNLPKVLRGEVANLLIVKLRDRLEKNIIASIPAEIKDDPPINVSVTYSLNLSDGLMKFDVRAASEKVAGVKEVAVSASGTAAAHTRVLDGKRNFFVGGYDVPGSNAEGERGRGAQFVTSDKVPDALLADIVKHGVTATMSPSEHGGHSLDEHGRSGS